MSEQSLLAKMMAWPKCSTIDLVLTSLEVFQTVYKEYEDRTGAALGKGFRISVIKGMLPDALRKSIDTSPVEMNEDAIREYIKRQLYVQRRNKSSPMDIGSVNEDWKSEAEEQIADQEPPLCSSYQHHNH